MLDPQLPVQQALFNVLTQPAIVYNNETVPVFYYNKAASTKPYILLTPIVSTKTNSTVSCVNWVCYWQVTVVTSFANDAVSSIPAATITDVVIKRLDNVRVNAFRGTPFVVENIRELLDGDNTRVNLLKHLRVKVQLQN